MASFAGVSFHERRDGTAYPLWQVEADINEIKIPGGNRTVLQRGGRKARKLALTIGATPAQLASLNTKVGDVGTLSWAYGPSTVVLTGISGAQEIGEDNDYCFAVLAFTETTA